jgi:hypothetical protein
MLLSQQFLLLTLNLIAQLHLYMLGHCRF